jgi:predicted transglutaminase-like cysteine proteinase
VDLVDRINYQRITANHSLIHVDVPLQAWLQNNSSTLDTDDLNALCERIKIEHPRYFSIDAFSTSSPRLQQLLADFQDYCGRIKPDATHVAVHLTKLKASLGYHGVLITVRRLEDLTPEIITEGKGNVYFNVCSHCGHEHSSEVHRGDLGIKLECQKCRLSYGVIAADTRGKFRYANEFLTGYRPPALFPEDGNRLHEMYTIWSAVVRHCKYTKDNTRQNEERDIWQTALETQSLGQGDCEDSSIMLVDWLLARGFQARVVLGHYGDMGGHAWVVVRLDGTDYLLESTEGPPNLEQPPYVSDVGARYVPDTLFDRDAIYVRAKPRDRFNGDYWSAKHWIRLQPREIQEQRMAMVQAQFMKPVQPGAPPAPLLAKPAPATAAGKTEATATSITEMKLIKALPQGSTAWQVPVTLGEATATGK